MAYRRHPWQCGYILEATERSYQEEMKVVVNAAALFAGFLARYSIVVYHVPRVEYLKPQIAMKKKCADEDVSEGKQQLEELEAHLRTYEHVASIAKSHKYLCDYTL